MSGPHTPSTEPTARAGAGSKASSPVPSSPPAAVDNSNDTTTTTTTTSITNPSDKASQDADLDAQQASRESSREEGEEDSEEEEGEEPEPPLEAASSQPPLPPEAPPTEAEDNDGWQPIWDDTYQAYYFYNSHTNETTWTNPRVPEATLPTAAAAAVGDPPLPLEDEPDLNLTYNPAIHGDYDPTAPYAQVQNAAGAQGDEYVARGAFNRFTGKFQPATSRRVPENYNDENKSRRQMEFYFDVDAAASTHDGRSLKAERQTRKLSRKEVREFQEKRKARKEEKRKAWLRD